MHGPVCDEWSTPWLLMTWQLKRPCHQQPWCWPYSTEAWMAKRVKWRNEKAALHTCIFWSVLLGRIICQLPNYPNIKICGIPSTDIRGDLFVQNIQFDSQDLILDNVGVKELIMISNHIHINPGRCIGYRCNTRYADALVPCVTRFLQPQYCRRSVNGAVCSTKKYFKYFVFQYDSLCKSIIMFPQNNAVWKWLLCSTPRGRVWDVNSTLLPAEWYVFAFPRNYRQTRKSKL